MNSNIIAAIVIGLFVATYAAAALLGFLGPLFK